MRTSSRPTPIKRAARFTRWLRLALALMVARCAHFLACGGRLNARQLDKTANAVACLVVMHAGERHAHKVRGSGKHRHGRLKIRANLRKLIGSRLRRSLRGRDFGARVHAILCVMRDLDQHARILIRRLYRGLTRQRILDPRACAEACVSPVFVAIVAADSS